MKQALLLLLALVQGAPTLEDHVRYLTSDECEGRAEATEGERRAAAYIEARFRDAKVETQVQEFPTHGGDKGRNVIGIVRGKSDEAVVIGAHYDHLGKTGDAICRGADDNASGTAVVLEMAARFGKKPAARTVVLIAFSGEEAGCFGSRYYVNHPAVALEKTVAMVNLDMVGRLKEQLTVFGADTGDSFRRHLSDSALKIAFNKDPGGQSDHTSFQMKKIPAVHLFTGSHADWHKPSDTPDKLNYEGLGRVADLTETLARRIADAPERIAFQKVDVAEPPAGGAAKGAIPYLGSMPDYGHEGKGVKLAGVAPGSPAEKAGLKEGDVLLALNGKEFADVKAYAQALFSRKPGEEVTLDYDRDGKRHTVKVTLGAKRPKSDE
jgi:hypothetical protein